MGCAHARRRSCRRGLAACRRSRCTPPAVPRSAAAAVSVAGRCQGTRSQPAWCSEGRASGSGAGEPERRVGLQVHRNPRSGRDGGAWDARVARRARWSTCCSCETQSLCGASKRELARSGHHRSCASALRCSQPQRQSWGRPLEPPATCQTPHHNPHCRCRASSLAGGVPQPPIAAAAAAAAAAAPSPHSPQP